MSRKKNSEKQNSNSRKKQNRQNNSSKRESSNQMKYEIANEFGANLGPETDSRCNGKVRGEMTKQLADMSRSSKKRSK
ncbi:MAG: small, acid-soluble spore protein, alpha/beta type [Bacilli bacterium]|nr:small, acid-soluble spore protein, alpha/beta type [Bacilli bacterium]MBQ6282759.1 small, acid-soluble spore protein, alpha/beta type [Bacilli bacterium]